MSEGKVACLAVIDDGHTFAISITRGVGIAAMNHGGMLIDAAYGPSDLERILVDEAG